MTSDLYEGFADRYDLFHGPFGRHDPVVVEFFATLFAHRRVHTVLDCACGTGHDLHLFASLGCTVVGSDVSPAMLAQAGKNLASVGLAIPLHQVDYRELPQHFPQPFDAVTCLSTSPAHMPTAAEALRALRSMHTILRPGGILVLTQGTTDKQWREQPRFMLAVNTAEVSRLFVIDYLEHGARYHIVDIFHSPARSDFQVWSVDYPLILLRDDYERLLKDAGFTIIECWGSYQFAVYDKETSTRLIIVATR